ncbi:MAG: sulfite exporter TauE/SafE family protein [Cyclobacteriaceae bacterium]|nr:sulfite exporter TauE/SafE family protein [Cyclobacteriaceae bacterium]
MEFLAAFDLTFTDWIWIIVCALFVGMSKTGLGGLGMLVVPVMAGIFGAKPSTGIVLPMLVMADVFGVRYYHQHAEVRQLFKLIPSTLAGVVAGIFIGDWLDEGQFQLLLAVIILIGIVLMLLNFNRTRQLPHHTFLAVLAGFLGGFTTMIGNAAGPVMSIYFLTMGFDKNKFIGTGAWFFLFVNVFKVPFHVLIWETITWQTIRLDLLLLPVIVLGAYAGIWVVRRIPERPYRVFILISILLAAVKLMV